MTCSNVSGITVVVVNAHPPSEHEWGEWLSLVHAHAGGTLRGLIFSDGGVPDARQRGRFNDLMGGRLAVLGIVSTSAKVRGVATAMAWFHPHLEVFAPAEFARALEHVRARIGDDAKLLSEARRLGADLVGGLPACVATSRY
jgi:hypothetical protein